MRKDDERSQIGLELPQLSRRDHYVRHGRLLLVDRRLTLGYAVRMDKRSRKPKIRDTKIVLVTPIGMDVVEHDRKGPEIHEPFEVTDTHQATRVYVNSSRKIVTVDDYFFDIQRVTTSFGTKDLDLTVLSLAPQLEAVMHQGEEIDVSSLESHMAVLATHEQVLYEG